MDSKIRFWSIITSRLFIIIAIIAIVIIGVAFTKNLVRRAELTTEINALHSKVASFEQKNQELSGLIEYLKSSEFQEKEARLRMGLRKPDEQVIILPNESQNVEGDLSSMQPKMDEANWQKWWNYFFKI
ncbi:MAG: septum formation initiator family protein [Patescibacteria group bacterium]